MQYDVYFADRHIGTVRVTVEGLYYYIQCQCRVFTDAVYKLAALCERGDVDIGVCVPKGSLLVLDKRVPKKSIGKEIQRFYIHQKQNKNNTIIASVDPNEPFEYISMLDGAKLVQNMGRIELLISVNEQQLNN